MKELLTVLAYLFVTLLLMGALIPSLLLELEDRREERRRKENSPN
jgi:hypothetical protein